MTLRIRKPRRQVSRDRGEGKRPISKYTPYLGDYMLYHDYTPQGMDRIKEFINLAEMLDFSPYHWEHLYDDVWSEMHPYNGEVKQFITYTVNRYRYRYVPIKNEKPRWLYNLVVKTYKFIRRV